MMTVAFPRRLGFRTWRAMVVQDACAGLEDSVEWARLSRRIIHGIYAYRARALWQWQGQQKWQ